ncbi:hypothetical protein [Parerythrobacter aestuarii]|uniref:hypothetical protein n=1 Tax=Parerythrobacter aestuarii TaxID=3020909 RepID=UPI0024DE51B0|nr:hypothetical protein [Parerythrobacter aestuarii]
MQINPRLDPDTTHPIVLFEDLYGEDPRAPQTQFVLERQIAFLEALAVTGSVRAAARRVKVSHQTCYRARRGSAAFGRAWDAALVIARASAEAQLAEWAMHGRVVDVWYHGEIVGQRTVHSDRLMLAHLARLDRKCDDARVAAMAEDFDGLIRRMRAGEGIEVPSACVPAQAGTSNGCAPPREAPACAGAHGKVAGAHGKVAGARTESVRREGDTRDSATGEILSPGQWSMRSMSRDGCPTAALHEDGGDSRVPASARDHVPCSQCGGLCNDPEAKLTQADCQWFGNRLERMYDAVPPGERRVRGLNIGPQDWGIDEIHIEAFEAGLAEWWLIESEEELEERLASALPASGAELAQVA